MSALTDARRADPRAGFPRRARNRGPAALAVAVAAVAVAAVALAVALAVLGVFGSGGNSSLLDPVAQAADRTLQAEAARMSLTMTMDLGNFGRIALEGDGYLNGRAREGTMALHSVSLPPIVSRRLPGGRLVENLVFKGSMAYVQLPTLTAHLPSGKSWIGFDLGRLIKSRYGFNPLDLQGSGGADPAQFLQMLRGSHARRVGSATIRGVPTTGYRGTIDLRRAIDRLPAAERPAASAGIRAMITRLGTSSLPFQAWLDRRERLRRMAMSLTLGGVLSGSTLDLSMDLYDYGTTERVSAPPAGAVYDVTDRALGTGNGATGWPPTSSSG